MSVIVLDRRPQKPVSEPFTPLCTLYCYIFLRIVCLDTAIKLETSTLLQQYIFLSMTISWFHYFRLIDATNEENNNPDDWEAFYTISRSKPGLLNNISRQI